MRCFACIHQVLKPLWKCLAPRAVSRAKLLVQQIMLRVLVLSRTCSCGGYLCPRQEHRLCLSDVHLTSMSTGRRFRSNRLGPIVMCRHVAEGHLVAAALASFKLVAGLG